MQVHVKTPHTKINIEGHVSKKLMKVLKEDYGDDVIIQEDDYILAKEMDWYNDVKKKMTSGDRIRVYRETRGYSQAKLGELLGGFSRQKISDIENGRRTISKEIAKKLAGIFNTSIEKFL